MIECLDGVIRPVLAVGASASRSNKGINYDEDENLE